MTQPYTLHAVVAMAANRVIGRDGRLPWHLPDDLKFFKALTLEHAVVMGRKTFASIGRPLPKRRNIVLSRRPGAGIQPWSALGIEVIHEPEDLERLDLSGRVFVIGGAEIYRLLLPRCASVIVSKLHASHEGDAFMPSFETEFPAAERLAEFPDFEVWEHRRVAVAPELVSMDEPPRQAA
ncbi:MAG: dihydrofolate reductase [Verrucomicrobiales bacterium]